MDDQLQSEEFLSIAMKRMKTPLYKSWMISFSTVQSFFLFVCLFQTPVTYGTQFIISGGRLFALSEFANSIDQLATLKHIKERERDRKLKLESKNIGRLGHCHSVSVTAISSEPKRVADHHHYHRHHHHHQTAIKRRQRRRCRPVCSHLYITSFILSIQTTVAAAVAARTNAAKKTRANEQANEKNKQKSLKSLPLTSAN